MSLKIEKTKNNNELKLEFTIEAKKFDEGMKKVYSKSAKYFNIPGFRKGKAPMAMVEKQYGSEIFYEDTFNEIVPEEYERELKENNIEAVSKPDIEVKQIGKGQDLIFTAIVQTKPEVKLGKYKGIELKKIEYNVTDADIEHELGHMADRNSRLVTVEDRPVENGDITVIDFEGFVDGKAFEGGKAENHELTIGSNTFIPGFEDQIVGMKTGEEKDINVTFPEEYFSEELKGKDAVFKIKLHEIKKKELPKLDDDFAKDTSEFDTLKELKNSIKEKLEHENKHRAEHETEDAAIKAVVDTAEVDIPSGMIETDFIKENEEMAKNSVKTRLTLEAIVNAEKVEPKQEDVDSRLKEMAEMYGQKEEDLKKNEQFVNYVKDSLKNEAVVKFIIDNAKIK